MMVIGLDIGTHSIKVASRINNDDLINFAELRTTLLKNPDEEKMISVGDEAIERYFNRDDQVPFNVELLEGDQVLIDHILQALTALKIEPKPDLVALSFPTDKFKEKANLENLKNSAKRVFKDSSIFILDEAICAAAIYKQKHPKARLLVICDLGKSALKLSLCDLTDDAIQIINSTSVTQFAWKSFEEDLVRSFQFYKDIEHEPYQQIEKKRFQYDCLKSFFALDDNEKYSYINCLEESPGLLENGGIHELKFLSFGDPENFLTVKNIHELYHNFVQGILSKLKDFIGNIEQERVPELSTLPIMVIGSSASPANFLEFFVSSINNHAYVDSVKPVEIDNPKFTVAEGALRIISNEIKIYEPGKKQIMFERSRLVDGFAKREETLIEPKEVPMFGKECSLQKFRFHSELSPLVMKVGEEVILDFQCPSPGEYDLIQSMDCFGKMNLDLRKISTDN